MVAGRWPRLPRAGYCSRHRDRAGTSTSARSVPRRRHRHYVITPVGYVPCRKGGDKVRFPNSKSSESNFRGDRAGHRVRTAGSLSLLILPVAVFAAQDGAAASPRTVAAGTWAVQPVPVPHYATGSLTAVSCTSTSNCEAVGSSPYGALAERWNGAHWSIQPTPNLPDDFGERLRGRGI
jgi:hypothetical protein